MESYPGSGWVQFLKVVELYFWFALKVFKNKEAHQEESTEEDKWEVGGRRREGGRELAMERDRDSKSWSRSSSSLWNTHLYSISSGDWGHSGPEQSTAPCQSIIIIIIQQQFEDAWLHSWIPENKLHNLEDCYLEINLLHCELQNSPTWPAPWDSFFYQSTWLVQIAF